MARKMQLGDSESWKRIVNFLEDRMGCSLIEQVRLGSGGVLSKYLFNDPVAGIQRLVMATAEPSGNHDFLCEILLPTPNKFDDIEKLMRDSGRLPEVGRVMLAVRAGGKPDPKTAVCDHCSGSGNFPEDEAYGGRIQDDFEYSPEPELECQVCGWKHQRGQNEVLVFQNEGGVIDDVSIRDCVDPVTVHVVDYCNDQNSPEVSTYTFGR